MFFILIASKVIYKCMRSHRIEVVELSLRTRSQAQIEVQPIIKRFEIHLTKLFFFWKSTLELSSKSD